MCMSFNEETRGSLVELTMIEQIANLCRVTRDELDALKDMLSIYDKQMEALDMKRNYERVRSIKTRGEELKILTMEYFVKSRELVMHASSYGHTVQILDKIIQTIDGTAYRILLSYENNIKIDKDIMETFINIIELEKKQLNILENSISRLRLAPKKVFEELKEVFDIEETIDTVFRKSLLDIYTKYPGYIPAILLLKDIFEHLEDISDSLKNVGEELRYLALVKTVR